jgi:ornithine decarboxylase
MQANFDAIVPNASAYNTTDFFKSASSPNQDILGQSVGEIARQKLNSLAKSQKWETGQENSFLIADLGEVFRQHLRWRSLLPRIEPFYGMFLFLSTTWTNVEIHVLIFLFLTSHQV